MKPPNNGHSWSPKCYPLFGSVRYFQEKSVNRFLSLDIVQVYQRKQNAPIDFDSNIFVGHKPKNQINREKHINGSFSI